MNIKPPIYVKHNNPKALLPGRKFGVDGPFVTPGNAETHVKNCEYIVRGIKFEYIDREEYSRLVGQPAPVEEESPARGRKRSLPPETAPETEK